MGSKFLFGCYQKLSLLVVLVFFSSLSFGEDPRTMFLTWLKNENPKAAEELLQKSSTAYRKNYGFFKSLYTGFRSSEWKPEFLDQVDTQFKTDFGITIPELLDLSNKAMKNGIGQDTSRYSAEDNNRWSEIFTTYLKSNWDLAQEKSEISTENHNQKIWKRDSIALAANESMGGNAGANARGLNFLVDKMGRIVFVGNFQDAPPHIRKLLDNTRLFHGTVHESGGGTVWNLLSSPLLSSESVETLRKSLTQAIGHPPETDPRQFQVRCASEFQLLFRK